MNDILWTIIGILAAIVIFLLIKIHLLRKSAREIRDEFAERLSMDTNTLIDISARDPYMRELAESINEQLRHLRRERRRFQQGDLELKEAVTNISHDLRTPLTAICGYLDLLEHEEKSPAAARYLEIIEDRIHNMKQLTEELFRYTVLASSGVKDSSSFCDVVLNSALEESIAAYYASLKGCGITPDISIPEKKIVRFLDPAVLSRIFANIISNAIKYSDGDLHISLHENGNILFSNKASRLDPTQVGRLFDRYYTVESASKSTGLGLSIARALTEQLHGQIFASYEGGSLNIRLSFPEDTRAESSRTESSRT